MGAAITGWGDAVPAGELDNATIEQRLGLEPGWIFERTGISSRRVVAGTDETTSSLATTAAEAALQRAACAPGELDLVIVATITPDYQMPSTAALVQSALGAHNAAAFDLNAACSGFLYALSLAGAAVDSGLARRVLVCGADVLSLITDYRDAKSCVLFGDGAGAVLVEDTSAILATLLALASVGFLLAPIVGRYRRPGRSDVKRWRGRDIDLSPPPPAWVGSLRDRFRKPPRF